MQGRVIDNRCAFHCDHQTNGHYCGAVFVATCVVWTPAVKQVQEAGWHTETVKRGVLYRHLCPAHRPVSGDLSAS